MESPLPSALLRANCTASEVGMSEDRGVTIVVGGAAPVRSKSRASALVDMVDTRLGLHRRAGQRARARVAAAPGARPGWVPMPTQRMLYAAYGHTATLLTDGRVLVAGGTDFANARQFAQII